MKGDRLPRGSVANARQRELNDNEAGLTGPRTNRTAGAQNAPRTPARRNLAVGMASKKPRRAHVDARKGLAHIALGRDNNSAPTYGVSRRFELRIARFSRGENMNHWIDLLIVIPSWLGVFAVIGIIVASVAG